MTTVWVPLKRMVPPHRPITYGIVQAGPDVEGGVPYIRPVDMDDENGIRVDALQRTEHAIAEMYRRSTVTTGDLVVSIGPSFGKVMVIPRELEGANLTQGTARVAPAVGVHPRYVFWALRSRHARTHWRAGTGGATFAALTLELLSTTPIPVHDATTQRRVAGYLDRETAAIDALTEQKRQLVALLDESVLARAYKALSRGLGRTATRPAGLPWLPTLPSHWTVEPLRARYAVQLGKMLNPDASGGADLAPYLRNVNVQWGHVDVSDLNEMAFDGEERARLSLRLDDLLVCEGGEVGRTAIWRGELEECYFQKAVHRLRRRRQADSARYLYYVMRVAANVGAFRAGGNRSTIVHLTKEKLQAHRFPFPPPDEQAEVVKVLDRATEEAGRLQALLGQQIGKLHERRSALITAAVTGQLDIRSVP